MKYRLATCEDAAAIYEIETACFKMPWSFESIRADISGNDCAYYFVAEENGDVVGFCGVHTVIDEGHIMNVAVLPNYRERGIGKSLLKTMMDYVNMSCYFLEVRVSNKSAISLYKRLGFKIVGKRPCYYIDEDAYIMWYSENENASLESDSHSENTP